MTFPQGYNLTFTICHSSAPVADVVPLYGGGWYGGSHGTLAASHLTSAQLPTYQRYPQLTHNIFCAQYAMN